MTNDLVVIGIGQTMRGDDAAGLVAVKTWQQTFPNSVRRPNLRLELAELPGISLLSLLEGTRAAVLVDAVHTGAVPGTVHLFSEADLSDPDAGSTSAHGWGVAETLTLGRQIIPQQMPGIIQLIGIEIGDLGFGKTLSPPVTAALALAACKIEDAVCQLLT